MEIPNLNSDNSSTPLKTVSICICSVVLCAVFWHLFLTNQEQRNESLVVEAYTVKTNESVKVFGKLQPLVSSMITTDVAGKIVEVNVSPGSKVERGDVLVRLVNPALKRELEELKLKILSKQVANKSEEISSSQNLLEQENSVTFSSSELNALEVELSATEKLYDAGIVSHINYVKLNAGVHKARVSLDAERKKLQSLIDTNIALAEIAQTEMQILLNKQDYINQQISALNIVATDNGVVTQINEGLKIGAALIESDFVAQVANPTNMYARLSVTASEASKIVPGMSAMVNIMGESTEAKISRVSPYVVENQIEFDAVFEDTLPSGAIPNMNISGDVVSEQEEALVGLPKMSHITDSRTRYTLYVLNENTNRFELRHVVINTLSDTEMYVSEGLKAGEAVLLVSPDKYGSRPSVSYDEIKA